MSRSDFSAEGGTLAIFIPTHSGLVIAADKRQSPQGIFCDGINKILIPERPPRTAVVITGYISLRDTANVPPAELCKFLASTPAPIDFGRATLEFLNSEGTQLSKLSGQRLADRIFGEIQPYLDKLRPFFGTRIAQIIIADFEPETKMSSLLALGVDLDITGRFQLQPLPVTSFTTVKGTSFNLQSDRVVLPFGEVPYFNEHVLSGTGKIFLDEGYSHLVQKEKVSDIDPELASSVAVNLIEAASKTTEHIAAPSGIGGGVSAVLLGTETIILK